ncbi:hypothetical protein PIB30_035526 [Stylosanthes scabra]|uniref:Uncharacterized protein n=1 Tax=Stylosanthes scabra TaxID=79078 RepID=A0ABU6QCJ5_9FABA|nr:hypothetical protein [Stylosanthes scabra]
MYERQQQLWVRKGWEHAQSATGAVWLQHLLVAIEESRSSLQFTRVTHCDWRYLVFLVEDVGQDIFRDTMSILSCLTPGLVTVPSSRHFITYAAMRLLHVHRAD